MTCRSRALPWRDFKKLPIASAPPPAASAASLCFGSGGASAASLGRRLVQAGRELLARTLAVHARSVLGPQLRRLRRTLDVVGRCHPRRGGQHAGVHDRSGHSVLGEHGHGRLADPHLRQQLSEVVEIGLRKRRNRRLQLLGVVRREGAERMLHPVAELAQHAIRDVLRRVGDEEHPDSLAADQAHGLLDGIDERLARVVEQQMGLVEEEDELGLVQVAGLGQLLEELGQQPHQHRGEEGGLLLDGRQLEARDDPAAVRRRAEKVRDLELRLPEELVAAAVLEADERAQEDPHGLRRQAADALQLGLSVVGVEEGEQGAEVGEVEERQPLRVGVVEDEPEALLLRLVGSEHLGEQLGPEVRHGGAHRHARADAAQRQKLDREGRRGRRGARARAMRFSAGPPASPGAARPETSPFTSAAKTGTPAAESCSARPCSVLVFPVPVAPAIRP